MPYPAGFYDAEDMTFYNSGADQAIGGLLSLGAFGVVMGGLTFAGVGVVALDGSITMDLATDTVGAAIIQAGLDAVAEGLITSDEAAIAEAMATFEETGVGGGGLLIPLELD